MEKQNSQQQITLDTYILENTPQRTLDRYHGLAEYAKTHDFGVLDEDVVVIDTETTGFSFNHDAEGLKIQMKKRLKVKLRNGILHLLTLVNKFLRMLLISLISVTRT